MGQYVSKAVGKDPTTGQEVEVEIRHSYLNDSGNMELSNEGLENAPADSKVNIVSKSDIQVKPGDDGTLQLDCEKNSVEGDPVEFSTKVCNGEYSKNNRVVAAKVNVAEVTFDNQKAHTVQVDDEDVYDIDKLRVNFRTDKWKTSDGSEDTPTRRNGKGPVDVKLRGKSFDIRCHGTAPGGGIALQPSGTDTNGKENKIKFESSRISPLDESNPEYATEGGKGLEFGTFNNEHTSLFTKDYRFNRNGKVYAATRGVPSQQGDKIDYPTQSDDFKDIIDENEVARWIDIIRAGQFIKDIDDQNKCTWGDIIRAGFFSGENILTIAPNGELKSYGQGYFNSLHVPVYINTLNGDLYLSDEDVDVVYDGNGEEVVFNLNWKAQKVYLDESQTTEVDANSWLLLQDGKEEDVYWLAYVDNSHKLDDYGSRLHRRVTQMSVVSPSQIAELNCVEIAVGGFYNLESNPVLNALKGIVKDDAITTVQGLKDAIANAFGW